MDATDRILKLDRAQTLQRKILRKLKLKMPLEPRELEIVQKAQLLEAGIRGEGA